MSQLTPAHAARRGRRSPSRLLAGVLATAVTLGALVGVAFAFWQTTDSSNPAAASATSLSAPTGATATETGATSVKIGWTNPGTQVTGAQYEVVRNPGAGQVVVCTVSAPTSTCTDSGLSAQTSYSYSVMAVLDNWQSSASSTSFTTMAVSITSLTSGSTYGTNWNGGPITGTYSAASDTTITAVKVSIQQGSGFSACWNGSSNSWATTCPNYVNVTSFGSGSWSLSLPTTDLNSVNTYNITAEAIDSLNITGTSSTVSFTYNSTAPSPSAPVPSATTHYSTSPYWVNAETVGLTDTVTYSGAGTVSSVSYYYCSTSSCTASNGTFIGTSTTGSSWSVNWTITSNVPTNDGVYYVVAVATDSLNNVGTSSTTEIGIDRTPPTVSTPSVNGYS